MSRSDLRAFARWQYTQFIAFLENEQPEKALSFLIAAANNGDSEAQYELYLNYKEGNCDTPSLTPELVLKKLKQAALGGNYARAQLELIALYFLGDPELNIAPDLTQFHQWLEITTRGNPQAFDEPHFTNPRVLNYVGSCIANGLFGFISNRALAYKYFFKAAEQGLDDAIYNRAIYQYYGIGCTKDSNLALQELSRLTQAPYNFPLAKATLQTLGQQDNSHFHSDKSQNIARFWEHHRNTPPLNIQISEEEIIIFSATT